MFDVSTHKQSFACSQFVLFLEHESPHDNYEIFVISQIRSFYGGYLVEERQIINEYFIEISHFLDLHILKRLLELLLVEQLVTFRFLPLLHAVFLWAS